MLSVLTSQKNIAFRVAKYAAYVSKAYAACFFVCIPCSVEEKRFADMPELLKYVEKYRNTSILIATYQAHILHCINKKTRALMLVKLFDKFM